MSAENLEKIILRAVEDVKFRELLFMDPAQALQGVELTEDELAALKNLRAEDFDASRGELGKRISHNRLI